MEKVKDLIYELYVIKGYSTRDVAKELGVGQTTVRRRMVKYGIPARKGKEAYNTEHIKKKRATYNKTLEVREERICESCGKIFFIQPHMNNTNCSVECGRIATANKQKKRILVKCDFCGLEFEKISSKITTTNFCSTTCHGKWKSQNLVGENNPQYKRVLRVCANCGKELSVIPSRANRKHIYCDATCMAQHYSSSEMFSGENSPTWKGGKITRIEYGPDWLKRRREIRHREKYKCHRCGKTELENGEELSIHHIKNFKLFEDSRKANKVTNLVGLCRNCHTFIHSSLNVDNEYINEAIV